MTMPIPDQVAHTSRTPAEAIKKPSADLYHAQGTNPNEQLHPSADHFVAQNYAHGNLAPTTVQSVNQPASDSFDRPEFNQPESKVQNTYGKQHSNPVQHKMQRGMETGFRNSADEQDMSDRFVYNAPPKSEVGRQHGYSTEDASGRSSGKVPSTHQIVSNLEKGERILEDRKKDTSNACEDRLLDDLTHVVKDTLNLVEKKDLGNSTRNIIDHSMSASSKADLSNLNSQGIPNKGEVARDVSQVTSQLRRVCQLMVTSPAFRSFLWEFYQLSRDSFGPQIDQAVEKKLGVQDSTYDAVPKYGQVHHSNQSFAPPLPGRQFSTRPQDESYEQSSGTAPPLPIRHATAHPDGEYSHMQHQQLPSMPSQNARPYLSNISSEFDPSQQRTHPDDENSRMRHQQLASMSSQPAQQLTEQRSHPYDESSRMQHQQLPSMPFQDAHPYSSNSSRELGASHQMAHPVDEASRMRHQQSTGFAPIRSGAAHHDSSNPSREFGLSQESGTSDGFLQNLSNSRSGSNVTAATQFSDYDRQFQPTTKAMGEQRYSEFQRPNQKQQQLAERWRVFFEEIKQDSHIQEAVRDMKQTLIYMKDRYRPVVQEQKEKVMDTAIVNAERAEDDNDITVVFNESKGLLERFAGGKSLDPLINVIKEWYAAMRKDEELSEWFDELYTYLDTAVSTPETLTDDMQTAKLDRFISRGQHIFQGRYRDLSRRFLDETNVFLYALVNDEAASRLRESVQSVIKDLFIDAEGRFVIKPDVYSQLSKALMPILSNQLAKIQVCRVEEHNEEIDFTLTDIVLNANDLKPDHFEVKNIAEVSVGKETREGAELHMEFRISAKGTTCSIHDANFYYRKHTFSKLKDSGILDATLTGNGLSFDLDVTYFADSMGTKNVGRGNVPTSERNHRHSIFKVKDCRIDIDKLKMNFRDANHDILYKVFKPIIVSKASKELSRAIENHLRHFVKELDKAAIQARDQAIRSLDKTGTGDRIIRGTDPDQLNVGHSQSLTHSDRQSGRADLDQFNIGRSQNLESSHSNRQTGRMDPEQQNLESSHNDWQTGQMDPEQLNIGRSQNLESSYSDRQTRRMDPDQLKIGRSQNLESSHNDWQTGRMDPDQLNIGRSQNLESSHSDRQTRRMDPDQLKIGRSQNLESSHNDWQTGRMDPDQLNIGRSQNLESSHSDRQTGR